MTPDQERAAILEEHAENLCAALEELVRLITGGQTSCLPYAYYRAEISPSYLSPATDAINTYRSF